jgi:hypothetical protein
MNELVWQMDGGARFELTTESPRSHDGYPVLRISGGPYAEPVDLLASDEIPLPKEEPGLALEEGDNMEEDGNMEAGYLIWQWLFVPRTPPGSGPLLAKPHILPSLRAAAVLFLEQMDPSVAEN